MVKQQRRNTGLGNNSLSNVLHIAAWAELCFAFRVGISKYFTSKRSCVLIEELVEPG